MRPSSTPSAWQRFGWAVDVEKPEAVHLQKFVIKELPLRIKVVLAECGHVTYAACCSDVLDEVTCGNCERTKRYRELSKIQRP